VTGSDEHVVMAILGEGEGDGVSADHLATSGRLEDYVSIRYLRSARSHGIRVKHELCGFNHCHSGEYATVSGRLVESTHNSISIDIFTVAQKNGFNGGGRCGNIERFEIPQPSN
jgi:hypothetical protein